MPGTTTPAFDPAEPQLAAGPGVDEPHCLSPEALDEFRATQVWGLANLQYGPAYREQARARERVLRTALEGA